MTKQEMYDKAVELYEKLCEEEEYEVIGIRYEDRDLNIGDEVGCSRHNMDREDERDFPEFGTEEYEEMYELDGASSWGRQAWKDVILGGMNIKPDDPANKWMIRKHAYLIGGDYSREDYDELQLDIGEEVVRNAVVLYKFY